MPVIATALSEPSSMVNVPSAMTVVYANINFMSSWRSASNELHTAVNPPMTTSGTIHSIVPPSTGYRRAIK